MMPDGETPCERCGDPVEQVTGRGHAPRRYCSDRCKQAAYRARLTTREAARDTLLAWAAATADETPCEHCGDPVRQVTGRGHRARQYCSDACRSAAYRARKDEEKVR